MNPTQFLVVSRLHHAVHARDADIVLFAVFDPTGNGSDRERGVDRADTDAQHVHPVEAIHVV